MRCRLGSVAWRSSRTQSCDRTISAPGGCQAGAVIHELAILLAASAAAFTLAVVSAVAGFGGGVLLLPVFTALFGLRVAVPMLTLTQLSSNASRVWFNRRELQWPLIGWFAA